MIQTSPDPRPEATTTTLLKEAVDEAKQLVKLEVALAKSEVREEVKQVKGAAIAFGASAILAILGVALLLVALALAIFPGAVPALVIGLSLLLVAGVCGFVGYRALPKKPLERTMHRLETDVNILKERVA